MSNAYAPIDRRGHILAGRVPFAGGARVDLDRLREGTRIYTRLRHVSRSGMLRAISLYVRTTDGLFYCIDDQTAEITGYKHNSRHGGLTVRGAGMDMGFHLVYTLASYLHRDGYKCMGTTGRGRLPRCGSNDHANRSPIRRGMRHRDGGYYFTHSWGADL